MISFILGILAGLLCAVSFIPQALKIFRTKQAKDLSVMTFSLLSLGIFLWLIYGILIEELPVILANSFILVLCLLILAMKIKYG